LRKEFRLSAGRPGLLCASLVSCALLAAGCGSSSSTHSTTSAAANASSGANTSTSASASSGASAGTSAKHVTIGVAMTETSVPFFQTAALGAEAAGVQDGHATVKVVGPAQPTGTAEATMAQNLEQSAQPDGFAPNPCILPAWITTLASLVREVPHSNVVAWDCTPTASPTQTSPVKTFVGSTTFQEGYQAAELTIKAAHLSPSTTGSALLAVCDKAVPILAAGQLGLVDAVKKLLPKVNVIEFQSANDQTQNTAAWTSEFGHASHVVFAAGACDPDAVSVALLKQRHVGGNFVTADVDAESPALIKDIETGLITAGVSAVPWVEGNVTVHLLINAARGAKLPSGWVDTGLYPITKANAAKWLKATSSTAAQQAFFTPFAQRILDHLAADTKPMSQAEILKPVSGN
jgi:ABC-type sugar transport system substrate-binding protein